MRKSLHLSVVTEAPPDIAYPNTRQIYQNKNFSNPIASSAVRNYSQLTHIQLHVHNSVANIFEILHKHSTN
jgi:hypothetical protein